MQYVIGIDEVGRGAWAGPLLVVAARQRQELPMGLKDSKKLSAKQREALFDELTTGCQFGEGWVQPEEIDEHGLARAMKIGVSRALLGIGAEQDEAIVMDGNVNYCPEDFTNVSCVIRADDSYAIVSAASIYAKVTRDRHMANLSSIYPQYGFDQHVGYGTELHRIMLKNYGMTRIHRRSYKPLKQFLI